MSHLYDPTTQYYTGEYPKQKQPAPGVQAKMTPVPDCGEKSYVGSGRLKDREALGGLDILALVAGKQTAIPEIKDLTSEQFQQTFAVNVFALFWITQEAIPLLPKGASIITTSSIQAYQPSPHLLDYAATKAAILNYSRGLAKQVAEKGIRVNIVAPGPIWTALQISGGQTQDKIPQFGQQTPMKRAGQPAELAPVYVYLASQESSYVTAEVHGVCGGEHLG
ncbi:SDR family oxidoreductase [Salmonella enterica]|nr:SDR family oxidoreductase [Salmonella enterica]EIE5652207.1 SDR family oxidoreductase [Salmonella enterica]EIE5757300.1 SDR family oxidoreductase [Salmonella enterica]